MKRSLALILLAACGSPKDSCLDGPDADPSAPDAASGGGDPDASPAAVLDPTGHYKLLLHYGDIPGDCNWSSNWPYNFWVSIVGQGYRTVPDDYPTLTVGTFAEESGAAHAELLRRAADGTGGNGEYLYVFDLSIADDLTTTGTGTYSYTNGVNVFICSQPFTVDGVIERP